MQRGSPAAGFPPQDGLAVPDRAQPPQLATLIPLHQVRVPHQQISLEPSLKALVREIHRDSRDRIGFIIQITGAAPVAPLKWHQMLEYL